MVLFTNTKKILRLYLKTLGRPTFRYEDDIKIDIEEVGHEDVG